MSGPANIELTGVELTGVDVAHEEHPGRAILHGVAWAIHPGERWAVCGGPGSGKSSLLCTAAGLNAPVAGTVRAFGQDFWQADEAEKLALGRRLGIVFDGGGRLFAYLTVLENLVLPLQYHQEFDAAAARERALELLARVGLEGMADAAPARLTRAQQQKVALVRAFTEPVEVLFLDAPLVGIGPEEARWWLRLLRGFGGDELQDRRLGIVASGYDFSPWLGWADRFAVLEDGTFRVVDEAEARALANAAAGPYASAGA